MQHMRSAVRSLPFFVCTISDAPVSAAARRAIGVQLRKRFCMVVHAQLRIDLIGSAFFQPDILMALNMSQHIRGNIAANAANEIKIR